MSGRATIPKRTIRVDADGQEIAAESAARLSLEQVGTDPSDLCYVIYAHLYGFDLHATLYVPASDRARLEPPLLSCDGIRSDAHESGQRRGGDSLTVGGDRGFPVFTPPVNQVITYYPRRRRS